ncbi:sugar phosphate isomerase/epimerase family protein [Alkalihalobacillus sp. 1P02AB]|uniref:sugar phosphate isomerase/epimerase family protein n=1 Tax=Alkalihalobacillus sp. 1P02AB TaxID=3132260 RepID=UPI0039A672F4
MQKHIDYAQKIGASYIATTAPEETFHSEAKFKALSSFLNYAAKVAKKHQLKLVYHPHDWEFLAYGSEQFVLDRLLNEAGPELGLELDTYWIKMAGENPEQILKRYERRVPLIHVKDLDKEGNFKEVGSGILDWPSIFTVAQEVGVQYYFVEQDVSEDPFKSIKKSLLYLKSL